MSTEILFYGSAGPAYFCSNFYPAGIILDGKYWRTTEHYFQAMKFFDPAIQDRIRLAKYPGQAAKMGRDRSLPLRSDWEAVKERVMMRALEAKFTQHGDLRKQLIDTGNAKLIEDSPVDSYWGWGRDRKGKNRLGILLMELRSRLVVDQVLLGN